MSQAVPPLPSGFELEQAPPPVAEIPPLPAGFELEGAEPAAPAAPVGLVMMAAPEPTLGGELAEAFQTLIGNREGSYERPLIGRIFDAGGRAADAITPDALQRGLRRGEQGMTLGLDMLGVMPETVYGPEADRSRLSVDLANLSREGERFAAPPEREAALQRIAGADSLGGLFDAVAQDPGQSAGAVGDVVLESLGVGLPNLAVTGMASMAGPGGTATAAGTTSLATEYTQTILQKIQETGGDPSDPMTWDRALNDPDFMAEAKRSGLERGIPIAAFDALTAGLAGRFVSGATGIPSTIARSGAEAGMQAGGGMAGEATAQLADEGEISSVGEIALEGVAELPGGVVETVGNVASARNGVPAPPPGFVVEPAPESVAPAPAAATPLAAAPAAAAPPAVPQPAPASAQSQVGPGPAGAAAPSPPPAGAVAAQLPVPERQRFASPDDVARRDFEGRATHLGLTPEQTQALAPKATIDEVTGYYDGQRQGVKADTVRRAQEHAQSTGESAFYVDGDIVNLGGLNAFAKNDAGVANRHYRAMTDILRAELEAAGADVVPLRTGGDEVGAVVINVGEAEVRAAMARADAKVREYARANGFDQVPHTKAGRTDVGVGLHLGAAPIVPGVKLNEIFSRANAELNQSKEASNVQGIQAQSAGAVAPGGQTAGAAGRADPTDPGVRQQGGQPAAAGAPQGQPPRAGQPPAGVAAPVAASADGSLPPVLTQPRKQAIAQRVKAAKLKPDSPGYAQAVADIEAQYERDVDAALAKTTFEQYMALNPGTPEGVARQAWEGLRASTGDPAPAAAAEDRMEDRFDDRRPAARDDDEEGTRGDAADEADLLAELDDGAPQQNQRGRNATPEILRVSFTNRRSWAEQAFADAGVNPDEATLWPIERQYQVLAKLAKDKFGIDVKKSEKLPGRFAVDQLLDLTRNLQFMAHVMGMPNQAMGLRDTLTLVFRKDVHYFGAMYSKAARVEGVDFPGGTVVLPKRSNSFAHEWMHALDLYLMRQFTDEGKFRLLSQQIKGKGVDYEPASSMEGFVNVMNHLFFDEASRAQKILALELKLSDPKMTPSAAKKIEAQLETLRRGNARPKDVKPSEYAQSAVGFEPGRADYWANPQEMLARAFEAYTAFKVEAVGGTTEAIAKGDMAYLSDAEPRLAQTFPKGDERLRIFRAFDQLFSAMAKEQLIADGVAAAVPGNSQLFDPRVWDRTPARKAEYAGIFGAVKQTVDEIKADHAQRQRQNERPDNPKTVQQRVQDVLRYPFYSQRSVFRMLERRYPKSRALRELADLLVTAPGSDRVVGRVHEEAVEQKVKQGFNRLGNIVTRHELEKLDSAGLRTLRDLLISEDIKDAPANIRTAAVELRKFLDTEWYRNQQAGLEIGYTRNGYLPRLLDMARVMTDRPGFIEKAAKVYEVIFDTEFGADAQAVVARGENYSGVIAFLRQAKQAGLTIKTVVKLVRQLRKWESQLKTEKDGDKQVALQAKIDEGQQELLEMVDELYDDTKRAYSVRRAEHWHTTLMTTAVQDFDAMSPDSRYTKSRKLPPQADKLLEDFYINDPLEAIQHYLLQSARRTEYATRFGAKGEKLQAFFDRMAREGVSPEDQSYIHEMVNSLTGRSRTGLPPAFAGFLNFLHAIGTMMLLPRAVLSSLGEPTAAAIRSGDITDTFKPYVNLVKQVVGTATAKDWQEISRVIGAVSNSFADTLAANRFGGTFDTTIKQDVMLSRFFKRSMLSGLTNAQRSATLPLAHEYLLNLSARVAEGRDVANSQALLAELGIADAKAFGEWLLQEQGVPTVEELYDSNGVETSHGAEWMTAVNRYVDQVIQNPKGYDRPLLANTPAGRLIYGILSFSMSFYANVWKRQAALTKGIAERKGVPAATAYAALQLAPSVLALYVVQATISTIREAVFNPDRWEEWEKEGVLAERMAQLGLTRALSFGLADPVIQAFTGLKYQRDLSNIMVGAVPGFLLQSIQGLLQPLVMNSEKTNNAEYKSAQSAYQLIATPAIVYGLSMAPGGRLVDPIYGLAMMYLTSPGMRDNAADAMVGPKDSRVAAEKRAERKAAEGRGFGRPEPGKRDGGERPTGR